MASAEGGAGLPAASRADDYELSDAESNSSRGPTSSTSPCPYRSSRFFDGECTRYFDCPTHLLDRHNPEHDPAESNGRPDQTEESRPESEPEQPAPTPTPRDSVERNDAGPSSTEEHRRNGVVLDVPDPEPPISDLAQDDESQGGEAPAPPREQPSSQSNAEPETGLTLREALDETRQPQSSPARNEAVPQITHISATPLGRDTALNPIAPAFNPTTERRSPLDFILPRWQPDAEVTYCPICGTQFGFFVRKHHCRKCGRVVCASCSPHRITIPYQYIVRPPNETAFMQRYGIEGGVADFSAVSGGEPVRLCNPCVPDPNTTPPGTRHPPSNTQPRASHHRSQSASSSNFTPENQFGHHLPHSVPSPTGDYYARSRSATVNAGPSSSRTNTSRISSAQYGFSRWPGAAFNPSRPHVPNQHHPHHQPHTSPSSLNARVRYLLDFSEPSSSSSSMTTGGRDPSINRPLPPPPQIAEEDECPVCHYELPSRDLPDFEVRREAHINDCIMQHSTYSPSGNRPPGAHGTPPPRTTRRTGIFPYTATEKDCVDDAECTICLEEFQVGVPMARLECLCRFHRACIQAWFVNHPGRCPVHQHDSFGY